MKTIVARSIVGLLASLCILGSCAKKEEPPFVLRFIGHDSFAVNSGDGETILADPYGKDTGPSDIRPFPDGFEADAVTISHGHTDHNYYRGIAGEPRVIRAPGRFTFGDMTLTVYKGFEGKPTGLSNTVNLICVYSRDGVKVVHLGDSGIVVDKDILAGIADADVVIVNIDDYVIPMDRIMRFMGDIGARTVVPAHWEGLDQLERFIGENAAGVPVVETGSEVRLVQGMPVQILVMKPLMSNE